MGATESGHTGGESDRLTAPRSRSDDHVVGAIDDDGSCKKYIIADISTDDAWISVTETEAAPLEAWR